MDTHPHPHELDELRGMLVELTECIFDRAPFLRLGFIRAGPRLLSITRGTGQCDIVLQKLEHRWHFFAQDTQNSLSDEWVGGLARFKSSVQEPCRNCGTYDAHNRNPFAPNGECPLCAARVVAIADAMEDFAKKFGKRLADEQPPAQPATVQTDASDFTSSTQSQTEREQGEKIEDLEKRVADLEVELVKKEVEVASHEEAMETILKESASVNLEKQGLEKSKDDLVREKHALEIELNEVVDHIATYASDLHTWNIYHTAQSAYGVLYEAILARRNRVEDKPELKEVRDALELKALKYRHQQISAKMTLGPQQNIEAEPMARELWHRCTDLLGESDKFTRSVSRDCCKILRRNGKHAEAEHEYRRIIYNIAPNNPLDAELQEWRLDTESLIAEVCAEQNKHTEAFISHRRILTQHLNSVPCEIQKAALSAVQCFAAMRQEQALGRDIKDASILADIERIWTEKPAHNVTEPILACGHELGVRLFQEKRTDEAVPVLQDVWERRKALGMGEKQHAASMATAFALVEISVKLESLPRLETLYHWILQNPTADQEESDKLWFRYRLGCVGALLQKWAVAETHLRTALDRARQPEMFGNDDPDTIQYSLVLAEVLLRDDQGDVRRVEEARNLVRGVWERRATLEHHLEAVLRAGHIYGEMLANSSRESDWTRAELVLQEVWDKVSTLVEKNKSLMGVLGAGTCYAICVMKQGRFEDAKAPLQRLMFLNWAGYVTNGQDGETSTRLFQKATELAARASQKKSLKYRPSVGTSHVLRLKFLLSPWLRAAAAVRAIEASPSW